MNNFYIYKFNYLEVVHDIDQKISATIIFCDREEINTDNLKSEIRRFYEENYQTDKIFIIGGEYLRDRMEDVFIKNQDSTFIGIPKRQDTFLSENLYLVTFDKKGHLSCIEKELPVGFLSLFLNEGLQNIFNKRGGLITSPGSHHFVFPSGKHCDKFLRIGNILLVSSEIYFIAFSILKYFDELEHTQIYCDTSSINSIAFALSELKNRFLEFENRHQTPIESFSSYEGLYKNEFSYTNKTLLLVSASTSSNIISYILERHGMIDRKNIVILFFLGDQKKYVNIKDQVACNLTESEENPNGIPNYKTYGEEDCDYCNKGSYAVDISGDVFSLEKPKINRIIFSTKDAEKYLSGFVQQFKSIGKSETILKVNYKEGSPRKYEIFIDYKGLLEGLIKYSRYEKYKKKLHSFINQYIPSNTKFVISLNDSASNQLSEYILSRIEGNYVTNNAPTKVTQDEINRISDIEGTVVVVGCCISNGKNLLYISRALRKYDKLRIVYFIGISQTRNIDHLNFLKSNLKQGGYGPDTNSFIEVESIFCNNDSKKTSWLVEIDFLKGFIDFLKDEMSATSLITQDYLAERKDILQKSTGDAMRGLSEHLFYPRVTISPFEILYIRKNFAFFNFDKYDDQVTQSDIYFTISNIINGLRNSEKNNRTLKQTVFVRNLIDPGNFNRFNDGIIQSSILRAAYPEELAYSIDPDLSQEMTNLLETLISYYKEEQGEALLEFLYAIAIKKLTLKHNHLQYVTTLLEKNCSEEIIVCFTNYIKAKVL